MTVSEFVANIAKQLSSLEQNRDKGNLELARILVALVSQKKVVLSIDDAELAIQKARGQNTDTVERHPGSHAADQNAGGTLNSEFTAPYRFTAVNDVIAPPEDGALAAWSEGTLHNKPLANGLCGEVTIEIGFDGPMLIGDNSTEGQATPLMLDGKPIMPGATLRGLARSTLEIAAFAKLSQTNLHRQFAVRDFEHEKFRDEDRPKVQGGWLYRTVGENDKEVIEVQPCEMYLLKIRDFKTDHLEWLMKSMKERYSAERMKPGPIIDFDIALAHFRRKPAAVMDVLYDPKGSITGIPVFSDRLSSFKNKTDDQQEALRLLLESQEALSETGLHKKRECVFEANPASERIVVSPRVWGNFKLNNSTPSRNKPQPAGNWATLKPTLTAGKRIPVFWIGSLVDGRIDDLGLTRVFKRAHDFSIGDVLARTGEDAPHIVDTSAAFQPDFVEALFGYVHETEGKDKEPVDIDLHNRLHLKGRVGFSFADVTSGYTITNTPVKGVLSAPRPSYAPFYLEGRHNKDWSDPNVRLAGRKRYVPRWVSTEQIDKWFERQPSDRSNDKINTKMKFLEPGPDGKLAFTARVRVHNVTRVELGGLLWALSFGGDESKRHMIGRAKMAGAGQAAIRVETLALEMNDGKSEAPTAPEAMALFEAYMDGVSSGWQNSPPVRELLALSTQGYSDGKGLDYMHLNDHGPLRKKVYDRAGGKAGVNARMPGLLGGG